MLTGVKSGQFDQAEIQRIDNHLLTLAKPREYTGAAGAEISYVKNYEEMSFILTKYMQRDAKRATVREYYQAFTALKKENKAARKNKSK